MRWSEFSRIRLSRQRYGADNLATLFLNPTPQISQRSTLAHEIIYHHIFRIFLDITTECSLPGKPTITIGAGVADDICLRNLGIK